MKETKQFIISKNLVMQAYKLVKANAGAAGADRQTLDDFEMNLKDNLYKIWNRMSSGSYFPPAVMAVTIPKKTGGVRILGIPTVSDRVAQMVVKLVFETMVEPHFLPDSYGYRPNKAALDAIGVTRKRCWKYDWVIEFDIKGLFDNLDHELLMRAVKKHTDNKWILLYIQRWLKAPMKMPDGTLKARDKGVPQGGVISPVLSNLFLHYVFDVWVSRKYPDVPWCRYADDGLLHCRTEEQAEEVLLELGQRFNECKLELHPDKTKIVYCKDGSRKGEYKETQFDFLGYTFRRRKAKNRKTDSIFINFSPAVSKKALKAMRAKVRKSNIRNSTNLELKDISNWFNPILRGWIQYYGKYYPSELYSVFRHFNMTLVAWVRRKYKRFQRHKTRASNFLQEIAKREPQLFAHWKIGMIGAFA